MAPAQGLVLLTMKMRMTMVNQLLHSCCTSAGTDQLCYKIAHTLSAPANEVGYDCAGTLGMTRTQALAGGPRATLPGFTQTTVIVTALLFLAHVGRPSCQAVPSPSRCLVVLFNAHRFLVFVPEGIKLSYGIRSFSETFWY